MSSVPLHSNPSKRYRLQLLGTFRLEASDAADDWRVVNLPRRKVEALLAALLDLRSGGGSDGTGGGNTVVVVEHEPLIMHAADHIIDMGPGAGTAGGQVVAQGSPQAVMKTETVTALWLRGEQSALDSIRTRPRKEPNGWMVVRGARANNLRGEDVPIPLGVLVGVIGIVQWVGMEKVLLHYWPNYWRPGGSLFFSVYQATRFVSELGRSRFDVALKSLDALVGTQGDDLKGPFQYCYCGHRKVKRSGQQETSGKVKQPLHCDRDPRHLEAAVEHESAIPPREIQLLFPVQQFIDPAGAVSQGDSEVFKACLGKAHDVVRNPRRIA